MKVETDHFSEFINLFNSKWFLKKVFSINVLSNLKTTIGKSQHFMLKFSQILGNF